MGGCNARRWVCAGRAFGRVPLLVVAALGSVSVVVFNVAVPGDGVAFGRDTQESESGSEAAVVTPSLNSLSRFDFGAFSGLHNARKWQAKEAR